MKYLFSWLLSVVLVNLMSAGNVRAGQDDFEPLFDGQTLERWRGYKQDTVPDSWTIEDNAIKGTGKGPDLITRKQYGDFELHFEWKIAPGGNSGVIYRASEEKERAYHTGLEYQILDDEQAQDNTPTTSSGVLYGLYGSTDRKLNPIDEYNEAKIVVKGNHIEHWLNGMKVVDCEMDSEDWKKKIAASKFSTWEGFAKSPKGHLVLQAHDSQVWFRNIRIKELESKAQE